MPRAAVLIPAYRPGEALVGLTQALRERGFAPVVVVDDGSGPEYAGIFARLSAIRDVRILRHAVNLGKGAALKSGMNFILVEYPETPGVITVDADGQHIRPMSPRSRVFSTHIPNRWCLDRAPSRDQFRFAAGWEIPLPSS